jgi:hypothetical protein
MSRARDHGKALVPIAACALVAAISLLWHAEPSFDPWAWLVWARQLVGASEVGFGSVSQTGWKPLPVLLNIPLLPFGSDAAPVLWVWFVRTTCLLCLVEAWRLGRRAAGLPAAFGAAVILLLTPQAIYLFAGGIAEPIVTLLLLVAVRMHLDGRVRAVWFALVLAALARPEVLAFAGLYALVMLWQRRLAIGWVLGLPLVGALLWGLGDWIGRGRPFVVVGLAGSGAEPKLIQAADWPGVELLSRSASQIQPLVAALALLTFAAALRWREPVGRTLGVAFLGLVGPVVIATQLWYPAVPRYMGPFFALGSVLAGIGLGRVVGAVRTDGQRVAAAAAAVTAGLLVALPGAITYDRAGWRWYGARATADSGLSDAIASAGGRAAVVACGPAVVDPKDHLTSLAYALDVHMAMEKDWTVPGMWRWVNPQRAQLPRPAVLFVYEPALRRVNADGSPLTLEGLRKLAPELVSMAGRSVVFAPIGAAHGWGLVQVRSSANPPCAAAVKFSRTRRSA